MVVLIVDCGPSWSKTKKVLIKECYDHFPLSKDRMNWTLLSLAQGNRQPDTHGKGRNGERTEASLLLERIQARLCVFDGVGGCMGPTLLTIVVVEDCCW